MNNSWVKKAFIIVGTAFVLAGSLLVYMAYQVEKKILTSVIDNVNYLLIGIVLLCIALLLQAKEFKNNRQLLSMRLKLLASLIIVISVIIYVYISI